MPFRHEGPNFLVKQLSPGDGPLREQLASEVAAAKQAGREPFCDMTADWCPPALAIKKTLGHPLMTAAFANTHVLLIDIDDFAEGLKGTPLNVGVIPNFFHLGGDGMPDGPRVDGGAWGENTPENMSAVLGAFFRDNGAAGASAAREAAGRSAPGSAGAFPGWAVAVVAVIVLVGLLALVRC